MVTERRLGRFKLDADVINCMVKDGSGTNIFKDIYPVQIVQDYVQGTFEYIAYSPLFELNPNNCVIPEYVAIFDSVTIYPKWVRV